MNSKLIQQYGEEILCYRLRTARHKKRMQYEDFDKQLLHLWWEQRELISQKRNLEWVPLIPPIQRGWKRQFVLRDDVARGKQADFYANILRKINTKDWSHRKDFKVKRRRKGRKILVVKEQKLLEPDLSHFCRLNFTYAEQQLFHEELRYYGTKGYFEIRYVFNEPWRFVLRIQPNMIEKVQRRDDLIESRLQQIDNYFERNNLEVRLDKLLRGQVYRYWKTEYCKAGEEYMFQNRPLSHILDFVNDQNNNNGTAMEEIKWRSDQKAYRR